MNYGLIVPKKDRRDFSYKKYFGSSFLPPLVDFMVKPIKIKDQGSSDTCVAQAVSSSSEKQEEVALDPAYLFAKTKQLMGSWKEFGADPMSALKASIQFGALEQSITPFTIAKDGRDFIANWENWDLKYDTLAKIHKKKSYFLLDAGKDMYDSVVIGLYNNLGSRTTAISGIYWQPEWTYVSGGIVNKTGVNQEFPHAIEIIGQKMINGEPHLVVQNSWGTGVGDGGLYYFNREVANMILFSVALIDADPEEVKKVTWGILEWMKDMLLDLLKMINSPTKPSIVDNNTDVVPKPNDPPVVKTSNKLVPFCKAIQKQEGWYPGSRSFRNCNPGNIKFTSYSQSLGAIGKDDKGFCIFKDEASGFSALCQLVKDAANNELISYKNCTIKSFFAIYAPSSDDNDPDSYAKSVSSQVDEDVNTLLKNII